MKAWIIGLVAIGLARYAMDALGWSDRAQVIVIVAGIIVVALVIAGVSAARKDIEASPEQGRPQDSV